MNSNSIIKSRRFVVSPGNLATLHPENFDLPEPEPGEVRIAVKAVGLNFADIFAIWGLYKAAPKTAFTPGLEYAGTVESTGPGVEHLKAGDRVMGVTRFGGYTTHLNTDARYTVKMPEAWNFPTAAAYLVQTLTAYYGVKYLGALENGQNVLIHSAAGGVGLQALQIAKAYGCFTIGSVGTDAKVDFALAKGYDRIIVRDGDFEIQLRQALEGRPLNLVMDSIGGRYFRIPYEMLAPMGRLIVFGSARYTRPGDRPNMLHMLFTWLRRPKIDPQGMPEKNKGVLGFNLIWLYERASLMHRLLEELGALQLDPPHVGHVFPFEQMQDAIRLLQTGKTTGKVVLTI